MRDYGVVSPKFWIGETGKALRGNAPAQVLALYLMTCPHANMIGVFHCPVLYMAHETGLGMEGASKALQSLIEAGYCTYDDASETVFVHRMAAYQVAESLKPGDNRVKGVEREWQNIGPALLKKAFFAMYSVAFHLPVENKNTSPSKAPPKALASQEQEQDQEQDQEKSAGKPADPPGFAEFWKTWPSNDRKQAKGKCLDAWKKAHAERDAALVLAHVESLKSSASWMKNGGEFIPAPLVYLNQRRWEGAESVAPATADVWAGAVN